MRPAGGCWFQHNELEFSATPMTASGHKRMAMCEMGFRERFCTAAMLRSSCPLWVKSGHCAVLMFRRLLLLGFHASPVR